MLETSLISTSPTSLASTSSAPAPAPASTSLASSKFDTCICCHPVCVCCIFK